MKHYCDIANERIQKALVEKAFEQEVQVSFAPGCLVCDRRGNIMYGGELPDEVYERIAEIMSPYIRDKLSEERNRDDRI